jgi:ABC-type uncharacterized transport system substrate-binding protein
MRKNSEIIAQHLAVALILTAVLFALCSSIGAQQSTKIPRVAYLTAAPLAAMVERTNAFRQGLRELGYVEGKNILLELRSSEGRLDALRGIADELVRMKVDVIVTGGGGVTGPVRDATSTIPIVMAQDSDPVGNGFVASLARPGGNITGLSNQSSELVSKRLEILTEVIPKLSRLAIFGTSSNRDNARELKEIEKNRINVQSKNPIFRRPCPNGHRYCFQLSGQSAVGCSPLDCRGTNRSSPSKRICTVGNQVSFADDVHYH